MSDHSLYLVPSRPAKAGDKLVTTIFANSLKRGLAAVDEPKVTVSLRAGTEVAFETDVKYNRVFDFLPIRTLEERVATFRHNHEDYPDCDGLEFPSGLIVLIRRLCKGQRLTVLQLPALPLVGMEADQV